MKKLILIILGFMTLGAHADIECAHKTTEAGTIIVVPAYSSKVLYYFDDVQKKAMAHVEWAFDSDRTSLCMKQLKSMYEGKNLIFPPVNEPVFEVEVLHGKQRGKLVVYPEVGGQFHGQTDFLPVDYKFKKEIIKSIKENESMIRFIGEHSYRYEKVGRGVIGHIDCVKNNEVSGVMVLHKRLGEVIKLISGFSSFKPDRDEVLENFMGDCVAITETESSGILGSTGLSRKVKLTRGRIGVEGETRTSVKEVVPAFTETEASFIEY